jgi:hypothetical protein
MRQAYLCKLPIRIIRSSALVASCAAAMATGVLAETSSPAGGTANEGNVPLLYCEVQTAISCLKGKDCKGQDNFDGAKLPLKITVDIRSNVVAYVEDDGWVYTGHISSAAENGEMVMLYGMGELVTWQMQVYKKGEGDRKMMAMQIGTADAATSTFGECEWAK